MALFANVDYVTLPLFLWQTISLAIYGNGGVTAEILLRKLKQTISF